MSWEINNKKIKSWIFPASASSSKIQKVNSIQFPNGKIISFIPKARDIYIHAKDYSGYTIASNKDVVFNKYVGSDFSDATTDFPKLPGRLTLEVKVGFQINRVYGSNTRFNVNGKGYTWIWPSTMMGNVDLKAGFTYAFENNTLIFELGQRREDLIIKSTEYTNIDDSYASSKWYAFNGYDAIDPAAIRDSITIDIKNDIQLSDKITWYDQGFTNELWYQEIPSGSFKLLAGHTYKFVKGKLPVDLGTY